jgi:tetratricopeptide (TPR) repeat protein
VDEGARRYAAFLSYSHKDAAAARRLHRRLETYRIPRRLVGSEGQRGPVPPRLTPVFRDREELPAAGDLSAAVRAALGASGALIILCSPAAAASSWVAKEIDAFRALHADRPVIAAILEGEPAEAFPPNLAAAGAEPLAADLRPGHDGRRLGLLKLVAALSGVPLDALVQRDAQRRLRRVTAVTGIALAGVVAMAVLTAVAFQARREAQRQRAEAEGLVEFMLTDLRDRLRGVGRLDAMRTVNIRALRYYGDSGDLPHLSDDALARRARILHAIGEDDLDADSLDEAMRAFREASAAMKPLMRRHADQARLALEEGRNQYGMGRVHELRKQWPQAAEAYRIFADTTAKVAAAAPTPENLAEAGAAAIDEGNVAFGQRAYPRALPHYRDAVRFFELASQRAPDNLHIVLSHANAFGWLGGTFYAQKQWTRAVAARLRQKELVLRARARDGANADITFRLAAADRGLACALLQTSDFQKSRNTFVEAAGFTQKLRRIDPKNGSWRRLDSALRMDLGTARFGPKTATKTVSPSGACAAG